jgi:hypothetical protein
MKHCRDCFRALPLDSFHSNGRGTTRPECKECRNSAKSARYAEAPGKKLRENNRWMRSARYGITDSVALELRNQPCRICGATESQDGRAMHIDHCHESGAVRGVLCQGCNTALGGFRDSPELLARAIHYLTRGADYRAVDREA